MGKDSIQVRAVIDGRLFFNFACYDAFLRRKRWRPPVCFALLMSVFAAACFLFLKKEEQAWLPGAVLLILGWGLPLCYVLTYLCSVLSQIRRLGLKEPKAAYELTLTADKLTVSNGKERISYPWENMHGVVRRKKCTYLYAAPRKAYLLPHDQVEGGGDALWEFLEGGGKRRKRRSL